MAKRKTTKPKPIVKPAEDSPAEYKKLKTEEEALDKQIAELVEQGVNANLKPQMEALHLYNEIKDITQVVLGYIANIDQTTISELHKLFNLPTD